MIWSISYGPYHIVLCVTEYNNCGHIARLMKSLHKLFPKSGANNSLQDRLTPQSTPNNPTSVSGGIRSI